MPRFLNLNFLFTESEKFGPQNFVRHCTGLKVCDQSPLGEKGLVATARMNATLSSDVATN